MRNELKFDPHAMKIAAMEGRQILVEIQGKIEALEMNEDFRPGSNTPIRELENLKEICGGYEKLLLYLDGAANVYAMAEISAAKTVDF